jgi:hypothetical protein
MKTKVVGKTPNLEDFVLGEEINLDFESTGENKYEFIHQNKKYFFEFKTCSISNKNSIFIEGFIADDQSLGKIAFEFLCQSEKSD